MKLRAPLSSDETSPQWLRQFLAADAKDAAALLNTMLLLNEEQVSAAIRSQLYALADGIGFVISQAKEARPTAFRPCPRIATGTASSPASWSRPAIKSPSRRDASGQE